MPNIDQIRQESSSQSTANQVDLRTLDLEQKGIDCVAASSSKESWSGDDVSEL